MQLVLVTQYFDTLKSIGESDKTNTLFLSHSPAAVKEVVRPDPGFNAGGAESQQQATCAFHALHSYCRQSKMGRPMHK